MDGMFGFHSTPDYGDRDLMSPENLVDCGYSYHGLLSSSAAPDRIPMFVSDDLAATGSFPCSVVSEAASVTPDVYRSGGSRRQQAAGEKEDDDDNGIGLIKAKIASHPSYPKLLEAYIDCQKVGAPPEIAWFLDEIRREHDLFKSDGRVSTCLGDDPELDIFMETYCDILVKYKSDLSRPFDEAKAFLNNIETQLSNLCKDDGGVLSSDDDEYSGGDEEEHDGATTKGEDRELKNRLLQKYGGHISSLKLEFSKKKKKGKLPKDARQILLEWWKGHYRWPYPTEADKASLAELTGLDQKQINNWFINQRKRHWKPSEHMQLAVMDNLAGQFFTHD